VLRNVIEEYLKGIKRERELDAPFLALLGSLGYDDIHFTHGTSEFGKDFVAKLTRDGNTEQWSFQLKSNDIKQGEWRSDIMGQMLEAQLTGLSHPQFDKSLKRKAVLVTNGRLSGNTATAVQEFNETLVNKYEVEPIEVWELPQLVDRFEEAGVTTLRGAVPKSIEGYGLFFQLYGMALDRTLSGRDLERLSGLLIEGQSATSNNVSAAVIMFSILASAAESARDDGIAFYCYLNGMRCVAAALWLSDGVDPYLATLQALMQAVALVPCTKLRDDFIARRREHDTLLRSIQSGAVFVLYPIACAQYAEAIAYGLLLSTEKDERATFGDTLTLMAESEPGLNHPLSDRFAVSTIMATLGLLGAGNIEAAQALLRSTTKWICDRYEKGVGLASIDMSADEEVDYLLGFSFEGTKARQERRQSLLATALCDLAAFLADASLYSDVVNDIKACGIRMQYFQAPSSAGLFSIEAADVVHYISTAFLDELTKPAGEHWKTETITALEHGLESGSYIALMLVLRDRYFPMLWDRFLARSRT
jgi:hypothetical protein